MPSRRCGNDEICGAGEKGVSEPVGASQNLAGFGPMPEATMLCTRCGVHGCVCQSAATQADVARMEAKLDALIAALKARGSL